MLHADHESCENSFYTYCNLKFLFACMVYDGAVLQGFLHIARACMTLCNSYSGLMCTCKACVVEKDDKFSHLRLGYS